jgi:hypothetical protein
MAKISTYPISGTPTLSDKLIGSDPNDLELTKNYTISQILSLPFPVVPVYADNAAALSGGLVAGNIYRITGTDFLGVVH